MIKAERAFGAHPRAFKLELTTSTGVRYEIRRADMDIVHSETINEARVVKAKAVYASGAKRGLKW